MRILYQKHEQRGRAISVFKQLGGDLDALDSRQMHFYLSCRDDGTHTSPTQSSSARCGRHRTVRQYISCASYLYRCIPRYRLGVRASTVALPVGQRCGVVGVGVAVVAEVRTGVVLADVLGHDAAAGKTLALVLQLRILAGDADGGSEEW